jgi:hypothetical protein
MIRLMLYQLCYTVRTGNYELYTVNVINILVFINSASNNSSSASVVLQLSSIRPDCVTQLVEHQCSNKKVAGSKPRSGGHWAAFSA